MRKLIGLYAIGAIACLYVSAEAQGAIRLDGWQYHCDSHYLGDKYSDPDGNRLRDEAVGRGDCVIYRGNPVIISIALAEPTETARLVAHVHRHNMNYKLSELKVDALVGGHYERLGSIQGFWGPTEVNDFDFEIELEPAVTQELRLVFDTGGILSVSELEVFGRAATAAGAEPEELPFTQVTKPTVRQEDLDGDGTREIILENSKVGLTFYPAFGGVCKVFYLKDPGVNLVTPGGPDMAMFRDQLWDPTYFFSKRFYHAEVGGDDNSAWVELWTMGEGGILSFTEIRKRITLRAGTEVVTADYRLSNDPSSQTDYVYGLWWHNFLGVRGQVNTYYVPTEEGVKELTYDPAQFKREEGGDHWYRNPARGWTAFRAANGPGMAIQVPFKYLNCFYNWVGAGYPVATHEWRFNRLEVKSGESLEARIRILPFAGMPRVDGCINDAVGAIDISTPEGGRVSVETTVHLASGAEPLTAEVGWRASDEQEFDWSVAPATLIQPGGALSIVGGIEGPKTGSHVVRCRLSRDGEVLGDFERPFSVGGARIVYHRPPLEERVGLAEKEDVAGLPRHDLSREVVTPHIPWANPYAGGPIKALTLTGDQNSREIIELAQRLELDFTYVKFRTVRFTEWLYQGDRSIPTLEHAQRRLLEELDDTYDLFLISGLKWDHHFTPEIRERIIQQVREGAGLVYIQPDGFSTDEPLGEAMGIAAERRSMGAFYRWQPARSHYLTDALPWEIFPRTRRMEYETWPAGEVLATLGEGDKERPLMVASQLGDGRVLALTYDVLTHTLSYRGYAGLTPILSYRGGWLQDEFADMTWHYWEHWYALLARACTWAAAKEPPVRITSIEAPDLTLGETGDVKINLELAEPGDYVVETTFRDRWSNELATFKAEGLPAEAGSAMLPQQVPPFLRAGLNLVDVIVRETASGAVVGWGAASFQVTSPVSIASLTVEDPIVLARWHPDQPPDTVQRGRTFAPTQPLRATVNLDLVAPLDQGYRLRVRLCDTHDRLLAEEVKPVGAEDTQAEFSFEPGALRNMGLEWRVDLLRGDQLVDSDRARAICVRPRAYDSLQFASWGGQYLWRTHYLFDIVSDRVEDLGLDVSHYGFVELGTGKVWDEYWHNRHNWWGSLLGYLGKGVPNFRLGDFAQVKAEYDKTGDKKLLARVPCVSDPEWREQVKQSIQERVGLMQPFGGAHNYCMGDEMSLTHYTRYFDFCWSPHCLGKFRTWLQEQYGGLDELNATWATDYAAWDDVVPMTLAEAKQADNPAPWADHRTFMNTALADFFSFVYDSIAEIDPDPKVGMSGTQSPRAGNGMDWWKMSKAFNFWESYNTAWSNEMRRSFAKDTGVAQAPYNAGYWGSGRALEHRMWWCLLHDTIGISAWTTHLFFYGDLTFSEAGRDTRDNLRELKSGIWAQVRQAERLHDGIALHYSQASIQAAELTGRVSEIEAVRDAWVKLLEDLGLQYEFVSQEQIETGKLQADAFKLLILPDSLAISAREQEQVRQFVAAGGAVLADMRCALMDDRCRTQAPPALDDLFGVRHTEATGQPPAAALSVTGNLGPDVGPGTEVRITVPESNLAADGAQALGSGVGDPPAPAVLVNPVGDGHAIYLNLDLSQFGNERKFQSLTEKQVRAILLALLGQVGIAPQYLVTFESGLAPHVEVVRYALGDLTILGLLRPYDGGAEDEVAEVALPASAHVYSMRQRKHLGRLDKITVPIAPGQACVYCLSPEPLGELSVRVAVPEGDAQARPGKVFAYDVKRTGGPRLPEVVHVTVQRPDGSEARDYAQNLVVRADTAASHIPLALNDPAGTWIVTVTSALSGNRAQVEFVVEAGG